MVEGRKIIMNKKPKIVWGAGVNFMGLWGPYKMHYNKELEMYFDHSGEFSLTRLKNKTQGSVITFASTNKEETKLWVRGVKSAMSVIKKWCIHSGKCK